MGSLYGDPPGKGHPYLKVIEEELHSIPPPSRKDLKLKFVQFYCRHGARTPLKLIPLLEPIEWDKAVVEAGLPHTKIDYEVCSLDGSERSDAVLENLYRKKTLKGGAFSGQLTPLGMEQCFHAGKSLRRHYVDDLAFAPTEFSSKSIYIRSTNINRCINSSTSLIAGMYGELLQNPSHEKVKIHVDHASAEVLYPQHHYSLRLRNLWVEIASNPDAIPGNSGIDKQVRDLVGIPDDHEAIEMTAIKDDLATRADHGFPIPPKLKPIMGDIMKRAAEVLQFAVGGLEADKDDIIPLTAGPMVNLMVKVVEGVSSNKISEKVHVYLCHDTSLTAMLLALEIFDDEWPPLCASIFIEVYEDDKSNHFVRCIYRGKEQNICKSTDAFLSVEKFKELLSPVNVSLDEFLARCKKLDEGLESS